MRDFGPSRNVIYNFGAVSEKSSDLGGPTAALRKAPDAVSVVSRSTTSKRYQKAVEPETDVERKAK